MIRAVQLRKEFRRSRRVEGRLSGLRSLVSRHSDVVTAVDGVSFDVASGEIVGYLGPNGAGKSTTIKMLTGILVPTSGVVEVDGVEPWRDRKANAKSIGVVFGQRSQLWWDLPLRDSFRMVAGLYGMSDADLSRAVGDFTDLLDLSEFLDAPVRQLSLGQRMRGDLAAAMLYAPRLLYLDEPTVGLDVVAKEATREFVAHVNATRGTTVVLTTHDLADVEQLCKRIILIDHGRVLYDGSIEALKRRYAPYRDLVVTTAIPGAVSASGADLIGVDGVVSTLRFDPDHTRPGDLINAITAAHDVVDLTVREPGLDPVIARIYRERRIEDEPVEGAP